VPFFSKQTSLSIARIYATHWTIVKSLQDPLLGPIVKSFGSLASNFTGYFWHRPRPRPHSILWPGKNDMNKPKVKEQKAVGCGKNYTLNGILN